MNIRSRIKQHPVASFIVLAVGLSYAAFLLPVSGEGALLLLLSLLVVVPTFVAFALVAVMEGRRGAGAFLRQCFRWRCPVKWYLVSIALGFAIQFGSSVLALLTGQISAIELGAPDPTLIIFLPYALLEEIGWRGFALRHSLDRYSPLLATLIVGIPWGLIHFGLTLFALPDRSPLVGGLTVLASAFPLTWIFVKSGRNVLVATVLHFAFNAFGSVAGPGRALSEAEQFSFLLASTCLVAVVLVLIDRRMWFARPTETKTGEVVSSAVS
jgi:membrane protease YdiL (CAAX protease family)